MNRLTGVLTLSLLTLAAPAGAQVPEASFAFSATALRELQGGRIRYEYTLRNGGRATEVFSHVIVDVRTPRPSTPPAMLAATDERFLFDALAERPSAEYGHAPLAIQAPEDWWSSIYWTAVVSWRAESNLAGRNHGVRAGRERSGFALESPALPSFRRWRVTPFRYPPIAGAPAPTEPDSSWLLREGWVVAPGVMADQVTGSYLLMQIEGACWYRALSECARWEGMAHRVVLAEEGRGDEVYAGHLRRLTGMLAADPAVSGPAKFVLGRTLRALMDRPPSVR